MKGPRIWCDRRQTWLYEDPEYSFEQEQQEQQCAMKSITVKAAEWEKAKKARTSAGSAAPKALPQDPNVGLRSKLRARIVDRVEELRYLTNRCETEEKYKEAVGPAVVQRAKLAMAWGDKGAAALALSLEDGWEGNHEETVRQGTESHDETRNVLSVCRGICRQADLLENPESLTSKRPRATSKARAGKKAKAKAKAKAKSS